VDRRLTLREILEKVFGLIPRFKSKDELLEEEFSKFVADYKPDGAAGHSRLKNYFKAYVTSDQIRHIIDTSSTPTWPPTRFSPARLQGRARALPRPDSQLHQGLRVPEPVCRLTPMLDTDTKRRIDTARDILVGKVPDPKSQVEQITIALIYKFMDDMDAEAEELGGERKFFTGDFARYGWAQADGARLGGFEMLGLYGEAISQDAGEPGHPGALPRHLQERLPALPRPGDAQELPEDHRRVQLRPQRAPGRRL
jgi:hypothetical protein